MILDPELYYLRLPPGHYRLATGMDGPISHNLEAYCSPVVFIFPGGFFGGGGGGAGGWGG